MTTLPAVVTIVDLTAATTLSTSALFEAVQTTNGTLESVSVSLQQIMTAGLGALPTGGGTGQVLTKSSATNFAAAWSNISTFISGTSGIAISGSTTLTAILATTVGLSVLGVAQNASAIPSAMTGTTGQIFGISAGSAGFFNSTALMPGPFQTASLTAFGVVYGNGTSALGATAPGTTAWPLVGNGTALAPSFQVLTVPGGGLGTSTLLASSVLLGAGTTKVTAVANATTGFVLTSNGTVLAPTFQASNASSVVDLASSTAVTGVLGVPHGGQGTSTLTAFGVVYGNGTSTVGITAAGTTGWPLIGNGTAVAASFQLLNLSNVTSILAATNIPGLAAPQGRLTLVSGSPVMTTSQSAKASIFYTPFMGLYFPDYNGSTTVMTSTGGELTLALDSNSGHTGYQQSGKDFDAFIENTTATPRLVSSPAWTNATTRATALEYKNGFLCNAASMTAKFDASASVVVVPQDRGVYVGSFRASADGQTQFIFGAAASGGTAAAFNLWNAYWRRRTGTIITDTGASYAYTTGTCRQARASGGNQASFMVGLQEESVWFNFSSNTVTGATTAFTRIGPGFDSTAAFGLQAAVWNPNVNSSVANLSSNGNWNSGIGYHVLSANEQGDGSNGNTFNNNSTNYLSVDVWL